MASTDPFLMQLSEKERKAYEIAKAHLGTSFDLVCTTGFRRWSANSKQNQTEGAAGECNLSSGGKKVRKIKKRKIILPQ